MPEPDPGQRDDSVEGGALDEPGDADSPGEERPPAHDDPAEGQREPAE